MGSPQAKAGSRTAQTAICSSRFATSAHRAWLIGAARCGALEMPASQRGSHGKVAGVSTRSPMQK